MENKKKNGIYVLYAIIGVAVLVGLDQWTKSLAVRHLAGQESITLIPGVFQLQYLENRGAAFGLLQNQIWLFVILTAIFLAAAVWVYIRLPKIKRYMPLHITAVVLVSGALGNLIDRIRLGYVVDFFYFSLIDFPIFNVADIYVVLSFVSLMICILFVYREEDFSFQSRRGQEDADETDKL